MTSAGLKVSVKIRPDDPTLQQQWDLSH